NWVCSIRNPNDFETALVSEREGCDRTDIAEPLHNRRALLGIHFQHAHGALDQVNNSAPGGFSPAFGAADRAWFYRDDFIGRVTHVNGVSIHEPRHDRFVSAHVGTHDIGVRTDKWNHLLHV